VKARPKDYVLVEGKRVFDVRYIGGGPHIWMVETVERKPAGLWSRLMAWWQG
jgi:hypothetical protein